MRATVVITIPGEGTTLTWETDDLDVIDGVTDFLCDNLGQEPVKGYADGMDDTPFET